MYLASFFYLVIPASFHLFPSLLFPSFSFLDHLNCSETLMISPHLATISSSSIREFFFSGSLSQTSDGCIFVQSFFYFVHLLVLLFQCVCFRFLSPFPLIFFVYFSALYKTESRIFRFTSIYAILRTDTQDTVNIHMHVYARTQEH